ncbi:hypothetical protein, partial [Burkholderia ubonensis]|uniref:hypothetical protein n=1 Tax=Burkholderia ubonensis TaxID=101571 RepID=UPI0012F722A1
RPSRCGYACPSVANDSPFGVLNLPLTIKGGGNFVYARLITKKSSKPLYTSDLVGGEGRYLFLFSGDLIKDRMSYASPGDNKGMIPLPQIDKSAEKRIAENVRAYRVAIKNHSANNEVGFYGSIPFSQLSRIVVKAGDSENFEQLKKGTIAEIDQAGGRAALEASGRKLEDLVQVVNGNALRSGLLELSKK